MESAKPQDPRLDVVLNGRYRITELLGEGGMGLVYRGERLQLGRPVAIKFLHSPYAKSPKYMARFEREARAMSKLSHPYCVSVIDFGMHDEPYIVMDFVTGETLRDLMDKERLPAQRAVTIVRQLLAGLAHAHGQGVIHRDIKPGNIMVGEATGVGDHVRIFDFGLAKLHDPAVEGDHSTATVIGTPAYMSPEQTRAEAIDARADLYAVGVLLFELLTGDKPFTGEDAYAVIRMQREVVPPKVRSLKPDVSEELEAVVEKALQKERDARFQTAAEFVAALDQAPESYQRTPSSPNESTKRDSREASPPKREHTSTQSLSHERPASTRRALLGLLLVAVVGAFVYLTAREESDPPTVASAPIERAPAASAPAAPPVDSPSPTVVAPSAPPLAANTAGPVQEADAAIAEQALAEPGSTEEASEAAADAGVLALLAPGESEVMAKELVIADQALDATDEIEATPIPSTGPQVRNISDVHALIDGKHTDLAIFGLQSLRRTSPQNPYLPYLLGDLYFSRGWWSDGLAKYREAIKLSEGYRRRATIHQNAIAALAGDRTYARARVLLVRDIGKPALPALRKAASKSPSAVIRKRAHLIETQIAR